MPHSGDLFTSVTVRSFYVNETAAIAKYEKDPINHSVFFLLIHIVFSPYFWILQDKTMAMGQTFTSFSLSNTSTIYLPRSSHMFGTRWCGRVPSGDPCMPPLPIKSIRNNISTGDPIATHHGLNTSSTRIALYEIEDYTKFIPEYFLIKFSTGQFMTNAGKNI